MRFHDLRHAFASMMLSSGVRIDVISQMLGHRSAAMTLDIYAHLLPGDQDAAVALLENLPPPIRRQIRRQPTCSV